MLFEKIFTPGLAHYSYLIGDGGHAAVIDPRRDCQVYLHQAQAAGHRIEFILETHRNEDYVVGSRALSQLTGAEVFHADASLDYDYGQPVRDTQSWKLGTLELRALHTPGHTEGSMSYLLEDASGAPWMVFCGDLCFAGDVGRVDLLGPERMEEMAGKLYDSIFERLLPLGDGVILCPAHGAGSVCGSSIAPRPWTTLGMERHQNPMLNHVDRDAFVAAVAHAQPRPPYFRQMERLNLNPPSQTDRRWMPPLDTDTFAHRAAAGLVVDTRPVEAFGGSHIPMSLCLWSGGLASFAGWFLPYEKDLFFVTGGERPDEAAARAEQTLFRLGYDSVGGYLAGGLTEWHITGRPTKRLELVSPPELCRRLDEGEAIQLLDVRRKDERKRDGHLQGAVELSLEELAASPQDLRGSLKKSSRENPVCVFCGSGLRSTLIASFLEREGHRNLMITLGGTKGWRSTVCPLKR